MALKFVDASDFKGRNVNENLYNIRLNSDRLSSANDIIFSVHFNGFNEKATGTETWSYLGDNVSKPVAAALSAEIAKAQGIVNRGQKSTTDLYVVSQTKAHMILLEICFLDNKNEIQNYIAKKDKVIKAILDVCKSYPQYNFTATSGGHYGLGMMDPGVSRHGYKEAVLAQEINQALLKNKLTGNGASATDESNGIKQPRMGLWYRAHVAERGWLNYMASEATAGTTGQKRRLEAVEVLWDKKPDSIRSSYHILNGKWVDVAKGITGTTGKAQAIDQVCFASNPALLKTGRRIQYRVHSESIGWGAWKEEGAAAGTKSKRIEGIQMRMVKNGVVERG